jgi:hypothetical protein
LLSVTPLHREGNIVKELLTDEGKKYASYAARTNRVLLAVPLVGKYLSAGLIAIIISYILKTGENYHAGK